MNTQTTFTTESQYVVPCVTKAQSRLSRNRPGLLASLGFAALLSLAQSDAAFAATAPILPPLDTFAVVSGTYTNAINTGLETAITGNVCFTTGSATVPVSVIGTYGVGCPATSLAVQNAALVVLTSQPCTNLGAGAIDLNTISIGGGPLGTFPPGCYFNGGAMNIVTGATVTLNGPGVYVFRPGGALTTEDNSFVRLAAGACASDVYWAPVGATTIGANAATSPLVATFVGNIFRGNAAGLSITLGHFAHLTGRALAFGSTVTTDSNTIDVPVCAAFGIGGVGGGTGIPTLSEWAMVMLAALLAIAGFAAMRRKAR